MRQAGEPSVEEILASIKQVIARDNRAEAARSDAAPRHPAPTEPPTHPVRDVLDLSELDGHVAGDDPEPEGDAHAESPLLSTTASSAMHDSLAALALLAAPGAAPQIVRSGETSLEGLVRDMLRPMLAQWLDTHLPPLVDRLVAAEIARIVRKQS